MYNYQYDYGYPSHENYAPVQGYYDPMLFTSDATAPAVTQAPMVPPSTAPHANLLGHLFELFKKYAPTALEVLAPLAGAAIGSILLPGIGTVEGEAAGSAAGGILGRLSGGVLGKIGRLFGIGAGKVPAALTAAATRIPTTMAPAETAAIESALSHISPSAAASIEAELPAATRIPAAMETVAAKMPTFVPPVPFISPSHFNPPS